MSVPQNYYLDNQYTYSDPSEISHMKLFTYWKCHASDKIKMKLEGLCHRCICFH